MFSKIQKEAVEKWREENPIIPTRKERRKYWRESRVKTHTKVPALTGTHNSRTEEWRGMWGKIVQKRTQIHGQQVRSLFEALYRPEKYLGIEKEEVQKEETDET